MLAGLLLHSFQVFTSNSIHAQHVHFTSCSSYPQLVCIAMVASGLFMEVGFVVAERLLYVPSFGYCLLLALAIEVLASSLSPTPGEL